MEILKNTEDELFELYAEFHINENKGSNFGPLNKNELIELGKKTFYSTFEKISNPLCSNKKINRYFLENEVIDDTHLAILITEVLTHVDWLNPAHISLLAAIIIKKGLTKLCKIYANNKTK